MIDSIQVTFNDPLESKKFWTRNDYTNITIHVHNGCVEICLYKNLWVTTKYFPLSTIKEIETTQDER